MESGKKVKSIELPQGENVFVRGDENHYLETLNEFHGDYDMDWIVMKLRDGSPDGKEVERYNCKFIVGIVWI